MILPNIASISQKNSQWGEKYLGTSKVRIKTSGCVLTCATIICRFYGKDIWPDWLNEQMIKVKGYADGNMWLWEKLSKVFPDIGIKLIGALDDVLVAGKYSPLDYKTRGYAPKTDGSEYYQSQLDLYSLLLESNGYKTSGYGYLVYVYPVSMERLDLTVFTTQTFKIECSIDNAKKLLVKASEILNMDTSPEPSPECSYCGYVDKLNS